MCNIDFINGDTVFPGDAPSSNFMYATAAILHLSNQQYDIHASLTHHSAIPGPYYPVQALVC